MRCEHESTVRIVFLYQPVIFPMSIYNIYILDPSTGCQASRCVLSRMRFLVTHQYQDKARILCKWPFKKGVLACGVAGAGPLS